MITINFFIMLYNKYRNYPYVILSKNILRYGNDWNIAHSRKIL